MILDLFAAFICSVIAIQAWRYLQIEIEYEDTVLINIPAWVAHSIMPAAFVLMAYRFLIGALKQAGELIPGNAAATDE